ncbi:DUF2471 family protein [Paraburkholderia mimosarum]|uniref:DUF2471 family protein n=1 Tax=Paraburkholderia mimosarum TaxID=312026 RepID=UPI0004296004|nr:DUF2471 family protein [Paraburkholderia mimosarum]
MPAIIAMPPDDNATLEEDYVALEIVIERALRDLQRILVQLARRYLRWSPATVGHPPAAPTWRLLFWIEEQAFGDLGFLGRHPVVVRDGFARLAKSHIISPDPDAPVDWQHGIDPLPVVYAIVRELPSCCKCALLSRLDPTD